jgi:hypothetical protein
MKIQDRSSFTGADDGCDRVQPSINVRQKKKKRDERSKDWDTGVSIAIRTTDYKPSRKRNHYV